jgi:hypothetical protein
MIGENMYHKIKNMSSDCSLRAISKKTGVSINTVRKYQKLNLSEASNYIGKQSRKSQFDVAVGYIKEQYEHYPLLTVVKLHTKLKNKFPELTASVSALEKYLKTHNIKAESSRGDGV